MRVLLIISISRAASIFIRFKIQERGQIDDTRCSQWTSLLLDADRGVRAKFTVDQANVIRRHVYTGDLVAVRAKSPVTRFHSIFDERNQLDEA